MLNYTIGAVRITISFCSVVDDWQVVYVRIHGFGKLGVHPRQVGVSVPSAGIPDSDRPLFALLTKNAVLKKNASFK